MPDREIGALEHGLRVAVIDAQPIFRTGLVHTLRSFKFVRTIVEGDCGADALRLPDSGPLDMMLFDLHVPGGGMEAVAALARMWPAIKLIILTSSDRSEDVSGALQSGARGYVLKKASAGELLNALQLVARGEVYLAPSLGARLFARPAHALSGSAAVHEPANLTPREHQILSQVSLGATNKEIGRTLNLSEKTVKYYMTNIMQKLKVRNRVEAVMLARKRSNGVS